MQENKIGGKFYRILIDEVNDIWDRLSFWTKASDVEFADGSVLEGKSFGHAMIERSKPYAVDDIAYIEDAPSWCMFKCTQAGTTADTAPTTYQTISSAGTVVTDGTAKFTVYDVRPTTDLSVSDYSVPSNGTVKSAINDHLLSAKSSGTVPTYTKSFYFDAHRINGEVVYGWNESSDRNLSTFRPFKNGVDSVSAEDYVIRVTGGGAASYSISVDDYIVPYTGKIYAMGDSGGSNVASQYGYDEGRCWIQIQGFTQGATYQQGTHLSITAGYSIDNGSWEAYGWACTVITCVHET